MGRLKRWVGKNCVVEKYRRLSRKRYEIDRNLLRVTSIGSQLSDRTVTFDDYTMTLKGGTRWAYFSA